MAKNDVIEPSYIILVGGQTSGGLRGGGSGSLIRVNKGVDWKRIEKDRKAYVSIGWIAGTSRDERYEGMSEGWVFLCRGWKWRTVLICTFIHCLKWKLWSEEKKEKKKEKTYPWGYLLELMGDPSANSSKEDPFQFPPLPFELGLFMTSTVSIRFLGGSTTRNDRRKIVRTRV